MSKIEWTEKTWNVTTGCTKISPGCKNCYAEKMHARLYAMRQAKYYHDFQELFIHPRSLDEPSRRKKPTVYFVNSMSDLFHKDVPARFLGAVFDKMEACPQHTFQVLTKRSGRMRDWVCDRYENFSRSNMPQNIWFGTSIEDKKSKEDRVGALRQMPAAVRFLSAEPLIGDPGWLNLRGIDWVIVGGESGPGARPMDPEWARSIRQQCVETGTGFFMKQMSRRATIPDDLMVREYPR